MNGYIALEDGTVIEGVSVGDHKPALGEIVFNTGMTGYQEILTDPSYAGQIVVLTYPLIGNYGINDKDIESNKVQVSGFIIKDYCENPSHWQNEKTILQYLKENNIPCISNVDTRMLTKKIRNKGAMKCLITTKEVTKEMQENLKQYSFPKDIVSKVSCDKSYHYEGKGKKIGLIDLGIKKGIINQLIKLNCDITVFPWNVKEEILLNNKFDAIFLSNGPGDPKDLISVIELCKKLVGKIPLFGICLGNQILALALGADTYKLKFGHRGSNHPVINLKNNKVFITSQNHGYGVKDTTFTSEMMKTYVNVNDNTIEGFESNELCIKAVQFHPEEGPGPEDTHDIFGYWINSLKEGDKNAN